MENDNENARHARVPKAFCDENRLVILQLLCGARNALASCKMHPISVMQNYLAT